MWANTWESASRHALPTLSQVVVRPGSRENRESRRRPWSHLEITHTTDNSIHTIPYAGLTLGSLQADTLCQPYRKLLLGPGVEKTERVTGDLGHIRKISYTTN